MYKAYIVKNIFLNNHKIEYVVYIKTLFKMKKDFKMSALVQKLLWACRTPKQ